MTREIVTDGYHIPGPVKEWDYWVIWDFEVKQPRAPWETGHCFPSEWRQDGDVDPRTNFEQAQAAADLGPELLHDHYGFPDEPPENVGPTILLPHAGDGTPGPTPTDPPLLFIDYDDVVVGGEVPQEVWDTAREIGGPLFVSRSYTDTNEPKAGLHQLARGSLPGAVTTVNAEFENRGHIEIYHRSRMTGFTWQHVRGSPTDTLPNATDAVSSVIDEYGRKTTKRRALMDPDDWDKPDISPDGPSDEELAQMDTTGEIDDIFSAIMRVGPSDIRLKSKQTADGTTRKSWDPSWESSKSGERLGYDNLSSRVGESWIYRSANQPVDALQVVAAEEGIIRDVTDYPEGGDFWEALQRLRERGANIPRYEGNDVDLYGLYAKTDSKEEKRKQVLKSLQL